MPCQQRDFRYCRARNEVYAKRSRSLLQRASQLRWIDTALRQQKHPPAPRNQRLHAYQLRLIERDDAVAQGHLIVAEECDRALGASYDLKNEYCGLMMR